MSVVEIIQKEDPRLHKKSREVKHNEFGSAKLKNVLVRMIKALESQSDGVALAAPQIGENLRIFIVSWKAFATEEEMKEIETAGEAGLIEKYGYRIFINPEIVKTSREKEWMDEGCLSVRPLYGKVERFVKCKMRAFDEKGKKVEIGASGLLAQIFQHEIDHLEGILFIDKAKDIEVFDPDEYEADA